MSKINLEFPVTAYSDALQNSLVAISCLCWLLQLEHNLKTETSTKNDGLSNYVFLHIKTAQVYACIGK